MPFLAEMDPSARTWVPFDAGLAAAPLALTDAVQVFADPWSSAVNQSVSLSDHLTDAGSRSNPADSIPTQASFIASMWARVNTM